jgi:hypothetical protein
VPPSEIKWFKSELLPLADAYCSTNVVAWIVILWTKVMACNIPSVFNETDM